MQAYDGHQGNWRPDLLRPADKEEGFQVCEINSRFPFNGIDLMAWIYKGLGGPEIRPTFLNTAADPDHLLEALFSLFNPSLPAHFVRGREKTVTVKAFMAYAEKRTGMRSRIVNPAELRLLPDAASRTGYTLYCTSPDAEPTPSADSERTEQLERIHQVGLQLFLDEYGALDPQIRHHLALHSVNDVRSMLLVHDKRLLGILHQELDSLVASHHILTQEQADLLRQRVVPTIIPGSKELRQLADLYHQGKISKDSFILKPARGGRGAGILFGDELTTSEWEAILNALHTPDFGQDRTLYVIQPIVIQAEGELYLDEEVGAQMCQRVGTYYAVNGKFVGLGPWRAVISGRRTCNMATGESWTLGSMIRARE